jgi:hypothetical protein
LEFPCIRQQLVPTQKLRRELCDTSSALRRESYLLQFMGLSGQLSDNTDICGKQKFQKVYNIHPTSK